MSIRGKTAAEITHADIQQLVHENVAEDQYLDYKQELLYPSKPTKQLDDEKDDILADVIAFANGNGGHIVIGIEADAQERAFRLHPLQATRAKQLTDQIRDLVVAHVQPAIVQLEIVPLAIDAANDQWVVVLVIPDSDRKPHLSSFREQTRFEIRVGNRKREMHYEEIRSTFLENPQQLLIAKLLSEVESLRTHLTLDHTSVDVGKLELWEINQPDLLMRRMREEYEQQITGERFFRITATPTNLQSNVIDTGSQELRNLLERPPFRDSGWTVEAHGPIQRTNRGLESDDPDWGRIILLKNGHFEFWKRIDWLFCWNQDLKVMQQHPRLYPFAVVEYPVTFVRLYRKILDQLNLKFDVLFQMQYSNIDGAVLLPYHPDSVHYAISAKAVLPMQKSTIIIEPRSAGYGFDPDPIVLDMLEDVYAEFGYERKHIPFFDQTGHCNIT